jgi:hypothetical protein
MPVSNLRKKAFHSIMARTVINNLFLDRDEMFASECKYFALFN